MPPQRGWLPWQLAALILGTVFILWPMLAPLAELWSQPGGWSVWSEGGRVSVRLLNTLLVMIGSVLLALAMGGLAALLLTRTDIPFRRGWVLLLGLSFFIPLPLYTCGWSLIIQFANEPIPAFWKYDWQRLLAAVWLHGQIGVPWAALIIGLGLHWVEPELEETALLEGTYRSVLRRVIWPRCRPFIGLAALAVAWTTWHEFTVTDFVKVNTLAEEVYLQLNSGREEAARAVAIALPACVLVALLCRCALGAWRRNCPPRWPGTIARRRLSLGKSQWLALLTLLLITFCLVLVPLGGLIVKAGMVYAPNHAPSWSIVTLVDRVGSSVLTNHEMLVQSVVVAIATGLLTSVTVLALIWLTRPLPRAEGFVWTMAAVLWSIPGPVLGLGLLTVIQTLIELPGARWLSPWLYSEPSPVPYVWAAWLRLLPLAWAAAWPIARLIPPAWEELAILDGAGPGRILRGIYWPSLARPLLWLALAVAVLSLGEISASKLIVIPGYTPLAHHIFQQLHSGMDTEVAALSLTLMLPVVLVGVVLAVWRPAARPA
jgi:iron(III) transport system permease protein